MASTTHDAPARGEKAERIVEAMRASVARHGMSGATFDEVSRAAGVSRGLLHYYFGSKERLLVEVVRRESEIRLARLRADVAGAHRAQEMIDGLVRGLEDLTGHDPGFATLVFELFVVARRNEEIACEMADHSARLRESLAEILAAKRDEGVLVLADEPEAIAAVLLALADGITMRALAEPELDLRPTVRAAIAAARTLIADG